MYETTIGIKQNTEAALRQIWLKLVRRAAVTVLAFDGQRGFFRCRSRR